MFQRRHSVRPLAALVLALAVPLLSCAGAPSKPATMTSAAAQKSNGSGIGVRFAVNGTPQVGRNVAITLRFDNVRDAEGASVSLTADPGLTLAGAGVQRLPAGETTTLTVQVTPGGEGLAYLNVFTTQNGATSATSIPIQVGKSALTMRSSGKLQKTPAGEAVISLPAR